MRTPEEDAHLDHVHETAQKAYDGFVIGYEGTNDLVRLVKEKGKPDRQARWDDLTPLERFGVLSHVQSVINDPYAKQYPSLMRHNAQRKEYIALDDSIRDALGYARFNHGG